MNRHSTLTGVGLVTLLLASSPLILLLVLPSGCTQAHASSLADEPRCHFPGFLQTRKNKYWMMDQSGTITTFDVGGGNIYARYGGCDASRDYQRRRQTGRVECSESSYTRVCREKRGDKYIVRHLESTFGDKFVCMEFLQRGISVVQVKMSQILDEQYVQRLCDPDYNFVDPWPWISEEHYRSPPVDCPFSAGFNLLLKDSRPPRVGSYSYYSYSHSFEANPSQCANSTTAPIRMESDCVSKEGVVFNFKDESCLPAGSNLRVRQRALCMATWGQDGEDFAMLRADNNDRSFFCLRISYDAITHEVQKVALFDGWFCPTSSYADDSRNSIPRMFFAVSGKQVVTEPCSDELHTCPRLSSFCRGLQCMRTCEKCLPPRDSGERREGAEAGSSSGHVSKKATLDVSSRFAVEHPHDIFGDDVLNSPGIFGEASGDVRLDEKEENTAAPEVKAESTEQGAHRRPCIFPENMRGAWLQRTVDGEDERLVITNSTFHHPKFGALECITFSHPGSEAVPLRRVLWGHYDNGCYPRFTCLHYNTPAKSVMRYMLADVQQWPLQLSDDAICDEKNFLEPPDMFQPGDRYSVRSWEVVRREGHIHKMACILPHYLPKVVSFIDDRGRSGCFVHGTYYSPRAISLTFFPEENRRGSHSSPTTASNPRSGTGTESGPRRNGGVVYRTGNDGYNGGGVIFNGTGSDGTLYSIDPNLHHYATGEERRTQNGSQRGRSSQGRNLKRSHGHMFARRNSGGSRDEYFYTKSRHSKEYAIQNETAHNERGDSGTTNARWRRETGSNAIFSVNVQENSTPVMNVADSKTPQQMINFKDLFTKAKANIKNYLTDKHHNAIFVREAARNRHKSKTFHQEFNNDLAISSRKEYSRHRREARPKSREDLVQISYECLAVMTYVDSYKSLLTATADTPDEILCWLVVDEYTVVILKTSSCNSQTAQRVLQAHGRSSKYSRHVHRILHLYRGEKDCDAIFPAEQIWPEPVQILEDDLNSGVSSLARTASVVQTILSLQLVLVVLMFLTA